MSGGMIGTSPVDALKKEGDLSSSGEGGDRNLMSGGLSPDDFGGGVKVTPAPSIMAPNDNRKNNNNLLQQRNGEGF
jgi:hypothetical protein